MARNTGTIGLFTVLFFFSLLSPAHAIFFWGVKSLGMGTATVGIADDNKAMEINPAGIAQGDRYSIDLNYERREYEIWDYPLLHQEETATQEEDDFYGGEFFGEEDETIDPDAKKIIDTWHVSVVDSKTLPSFAMGLYFTGLNFPSQTFQEGVGYNVGVAMAGDFAEIVYVGANGKFMQLTEQDSMFNADVGILIRAADLIGIGLVGHNLFGANEEYYVNRDLALGVAGFILHYAQIDFDVTKDFDSSATNTWNFALGAQGVLLGGLTLRGGFYWNQVNERNLYGLGIGWTDKEHGSLAYSFQGDVDNIHNFIHSIHLNVVF